MNIVKSTATKLEINQVENLDQITVFLENFENGKGKITVSCYGQSWTAYWGAMGTDLIDFVLSCNADYISGYFAPQLHSSKFSGCVLANNVRLAICKARRQYEYSAAEARELFNDCDELENVESVQDLWSCNTDLLAAAFGDEWWFDASNATAPNPDYEYLSRIIHAVQKALREVQ